MRHSIRSLLPLISQGNHNCCVSRDIRQFKPSIHLIARIIDVNNWLSWARVNCYRKWITQAINTEITRQNNNRWIMIHKSSYCISSSSDIGPLWIKWIGSINSSPAGQNCRHFVDDIFKCIFVNEMFLFKVPLDFAPKVPTGLDNWVGAE